MSKYADKRALVIGEVGASASDNAVIKRFVQPASKEIEFYGFNAAIGTRSTTSGGEVELVDETGSDAIYATVSIDDAGETFVEGSPDGTNSVSSTFPFKVTGSTTPRVWALKLNKATDASCDLSVELHCSYPGL